MTDQEIVDLTNSLAAKFYEHHGCSRPPDFRFDMATHPQEELMWTLAAEAMEFLRDTDANDARSNLRDARRGRQRAPAVSTGDGS